MLDGVGEVVILETDLFLLWGSVAYQFGPNIRSATRGSFIFNTTPAVEVKWNQFTKG